MKWTKILAVLLAVLMLSLPLMVACNDEEGDPEDYEGELNGGGKTSPTWEEYQAMSADEKLAFYYTFPTADDFFDWRDKAKKEYEDSKDDVIIGGDADINL